MQPASSPHFIQASGADVRALHVRVEDLETESRRSIGWKKIDKSHTQSRNVSASVFLDCPMELNRGPNREWNRIPIHFSPEGSVV